MKRVFILCCCFLALHLSSSPTHAQSDIKQVPIQSLYRVVPDDSKARQPKNPFSTGPLTYFQIGNEKYPWVISDFKTVFITPANTDFNNFAPGRYLDDKHTPLWVQEYSARKDGLPNPIGLNKWAKPIVITARLPYDLGPDTPMLPGYKMAKVNLPYSEIDKAIESRIADIARQAAQELEPLVGLPINYIDPDASEANETGNLRIVYVDDLKYWKNIYKGDHHIVERANPPVISFKPDIEDQVDTKYSFTPALNNQVEGYIIPDKDNHIDFAYCYVWKNHKPEVFKALVLECLLRSLGFPNTIKSDTKLLGTWNREFVNPISSEKIKNKYSPFERLTSEETKQLAEANKYTNRMPQDISDYEKLLIRLLYDPSLIPGMYYKDIVPLYSLLMPKE